MPWDAQGEAEAALRTIVADPQFGPAALSDAQMMTHMLNDILPDSPKELRVLIAASDVDVPGMLQTNVSQGLDWHTASRQAAVSFQDRTALTPEACRWAVSVLGSALRLDAARARPETATAQQAAQPGNDQRTTTAPAPRAVPAVTPEPRVSPGRPKGLRIGAALVAAAGAILIIWSCALTYSAEHFPALHIPATPSVSYPASSASYSLFSQVRLSLDSSWWHAIPPVAVAVLGIGAAVLLLVARAEWLRGLAAGMFVACGIATILVWAQTGFLFSHPGPAEIVGVLAGLLLLAAALIAFTCRKAIKAAGEGHIGGPQVSKR